MKNTTAVLGSKKETRTTLEIDQHWHWRHVAKVLENQIENETA